MSKIQLIECQNCGAPLSVESSVNVVQCEYCGLQSSMGGSTKRKAERVGPRLTEALAIQITKERGVVLVGRNTVVPITKTLVLGTNNDDQESFTLTLRAGNFPRPASNRLLGTFVLPLRERGQRGTVGAGLTVAIAVDGATTVTMKEKGHDNSVRGGDMIVAVKE